MYNRMFIIVMFIIAKPRQTKKRSTRADGYKQHKMSILQNGLKECGPSIFSDILQGFVRVLLFSESTKLQRQARGCRGQKWSEYVVCMYASFRMKPTNLYGQQVLINKYVRVEMTVSCRRICSLCCHGFKKSYMCADKCRENHLEEQNPK